MGIRIDYVDDAPSTGAWILYAASKSDPIPDDRCIAIAYHGDTWRRLERGVDVKRVYRRVGLDLVFDETSPTFSGPFDAQFDIIANAFYYLASLTERQRSSRSPTRQLYSESLAARLSVSPDFVDRIAAYLGELVKQLFLRLGIPYCSEPVFPSGHLFALVASHDVDFVPLGRLDNLSQGARTFLRHLVRQRSPGDAARAGVQFARMMLAGKDPYGRVPEIIAEETARGVRSSFQVAVARRHPADVNYDIRDDRVRDYLRVIVDAGFDLCLHGSYRSTERLAWYVEEAHLLSERLGQPLGSRQHFLSFDYDTLFRAQEAAGIRYDMSIGYPDRCGPRAGFSFPYFPYSLEEDRPYDVLEIPLFYMDVTLQSYMRLSARAAWGVLERGLEDLMRKGGAVSMVWHPIVFGGARDPGYDQLYWALIERVRELGGLVTDARTLHDEWRRRARSYASFARLSP